MAEYINKADIETVYCFKSCEECRNEMCPSELFGGLPTIEIVHCENCRHYIPDDEEDNFGECFSLRDIVRGDDATSVYVDGDFFCKFGERKE